MGLFDKKKRGRDDFDSPVEQIDVNAADHAAFPVGVPERDDDEPEISLERAPAPHARGKDAPPDAARAARPSSASAYGVEDAIALMRTLPQENLELVVQVVKHTLHSAHIDIGAIIEDATGKQQRIDSRVAVLRDAISDLEKEIAVRRREIDELEADHRETSKVKERLMLAEKLTSAPSPRAEPTAEPWRPRPSPHVLQRTKPPSAPPPIAPSGSSDSGPVTGASNAGASSGGSGPVSDRSNATGGTMPPPGGVTAKPAHSAPKK